MGNKGGAAEVEGGKQNGKTARKSRHHFRVSPLLKKKKKKKSLGIFLYICTSKLEAGDVATHKIMRSDLAVCRK